MTNTTSQSLSTTIKVNTELKSLLWNFWSTKFEGCNLGEADAVVDELIEKIFDNGAKQLVKNIQNKK